MVNNKISGGSNIRIPTQLLARLKERQRPHQAIAGVIEELLLDVTEAVCPICGEHSAGCKVHKVCADNKEAKGY